MTEDPLRMVQQLVNLTTELEQNRTVVCGVWEQINVTQDRRRFEHRCGSLCRQSSRRCTACSPAAGGPIEERTIRVAVIQPPRVGLVGVAVDFEMIPVVTVPSRPRGDPIASAESPPFGTPRLSAPAFALRSRAWPDRSPRPRPTARRQIVVFPVADRNMSTT